MFNHYKQCECKHHNGQKATDESKETDPTKPTTLV